MHLFLAGKNTIKWRCYKEKVENNIENFAKKFSWENQSTALDLTGSRADHLYGRVQLKGEDNAIIKHLKILTITMKTSLAPRKSFPLLIRIKFSRS